MILQNIDSNVWFEIAVGFYPVTCFLGDSVSFHLNHTLKSIICRIVLHYSIFGGHKTILEVKFEFFVFCSPKVIFFLVLKFITRASNEKRLSAESFCIFKVLRGQKPIFERQIRNLREKVPTYLVHFPLRFAHDFTVIRASVKSRLLTEIGSQFC